MGMRAIKLKDLVLLSRQFAAMLKGGIQINRCLEILAEQCKQANVKKVLNAVGQIGRAHV